MNRVFKNIIILASITSLIMCIPIKAEWSWILSPFATAIQVPFYWAKEKITAKETITNVLSQKPVSSNDINDITGALNRISQPIRPNPAAGVFDSTDSKNILYSTDHERITVTEILSLKNTLPHPYFGPLSRKLITGQQFSTTESTPSLVPINNDSNQNQEVFQEKAEEQERGLEKTQSNQFTGLCDGFAKAHHDASKSVKARAEAIKKTEQEQAKIEQTIRDWLNKTKAEAVIVKCEEFGVTLTITENREFSVQEYTTDYPATPEKKAAFLKYIEQFVKEYSGSSDKPITGAHTQPAVSHATAKKSATLVSVLNDIISKLLNDQITILDIGKELQQYKIKESSKGTRKQRQLLKLALDKNWKRLLNQENQNLLSANSHKNPHLESIIQAGVYQYLSKFGLKVELELKKILANNQK